MNFLKKHPSIACAFILMITSALASFYPLLTLWFNLAIFIISLVAGILGILEARKSDQWQEGQEFIMALELDRKKVENGEMSSADFTTKYAVFLPPIQSPQKLRAPEPRRSK